MTNKLAGIIQTGYTSGVYGNTGEYFTCIYTDDDRLSSFCFSGQYGAEYRVREAMEQAGFDCKSYLACDYGKLVKKDIPKKLYMREYEAIAYIKNGFASED